MNWKKFELNFSCSPYSIGMPKVMRDSEERAVKVPSLSELSAHTSKNLSYAPFILKADISQCFPSIYTHSIAWAAHGVEESKKDTNPKSSVNNFNALDFFVRNGQRGNTRGVLVGPDAYRLIAEFVLAKIDERLHEAVDNLVVGAVRHVDDFYIGLRSEHDAQSVLSHLREVLAGYELHLNDHKTKIFSSLEPINDLWAQRLRDHMKLSKSIRMPVFGGRVALMGTPLDQNLLERAISEAVASAAEIGSDSPIKILLRNLDEAQVYFSPQWSYVETNLQRIVQKHVHALDYACLLVAKRSGAGGGIDTDGWKSVAEIIIKRSLALNHHHETAWMIWLLIVCNIGVSRPMLEELSRSQNGHIRAMLAQAYVDGKIYRDPKLRLGSGLSTTDGNWLTHLVSRSQGYTGASFSGLFADEFQHLADRKIKLIDFGSHAKRFTEDGQRAISRVRYGYDNDEGDDDDHFLQDDEEFQYEGFDDPL
ncbi:RNA-directed DNA polymerase [Ponticoccus sp. (in: a-proteobacteria)]|uniref:RNA-directed DNA polymerase n=1 Tax=Ponticoccus sp. (in: a-proteobacteria) TaxID=1925025 RepID=UPI003AB37E74